MWTSDYSTTASGYGWVSNLTAVRSAAGNASSSFYTSKVRSFLPSPLTRLCSFLFTIDSSSSPLTFNSLPSQAKPSMKSSSPNPRSSRSSPTGAQAASKVPSSSPPTLPSLPHPPSSTSSRARLGPQDHTERQRSPSPKANRS